MSQSIVLVGGGGHSASAIEVIEAEGRFHIVGIVELPEKIDRTVLEYPVRWNDADIPELARKYQHFHITVGQIKSPETRIRIYGRIRNAKGHFPIVIAPTAWVSRRARIGEGTIIMHQALVNARAQIGVNCIINTRALIEHDARIGNHCHIATAAVVNGGTAIGEGAFIGSGAILREGITIGPRAMIGCGVSVFRDVAEGSILKGRAPELETTR